MYPNSTIIICGVDYNLWELLWDNEGLNYSYSTTICAPCISECFVTANCFFQKNSISSTNDFLLDKIFCYTENPAVEKSVEPLVLIDAYHLKLCITSTNFTSLFSSNHNYYFYNFSKTDFLSIR